MATSDALKAALANLDNLTAQSEAQADAQADDSSQRDAWNKNCDSVASSYTYPGSDLTDEEVEDLFRSDDTDDSQAADTFTHIADAASGLVRKTIRAKGLDEKAVLVELHRSKFGTSRKDELASSEYGAGNVTKHLFKNSTRMERVNAAYYAVYKFVNENTLPWAKGVRILKIDNYMGFTSEMRKLVADANRAASDLVANWDYEVQLDLNRLRRIETETGKTGLADPDNYPDAGEIGEKFGIEVRYMPVPSTGDFRVAISDEDKESLQRQIEEAETDASRHVIEQMLKPMQAAVEKLNVPIGADGAVFRDSLIENLVEVAERMERVNLADDPTITEKIAALKSLAKEYSKDKESLRKAPDVRKDAAKKIDALMGSMAGLV